MARIRPVTSLRAGSASVSGSVYAEHTGSGALVPSSSSLAGTGNVEDGVDPPPPGDHAYFDALRMDSAALSLVARDGSSFSGAMRSLSEIRSLQAAVQLGRVTYSATYDAAQCEFPPGVVSYSEDQMRFSLPARYTTGTLFFSWEAMFSSNWNTWDIDAVEVHKEFQIANSGSGDNRRLEIRTRYDQSSTNVGTIDTRSYIWGGGGQPIKNPPDAVFEIVGDRWIRYWVFVDLDNGPQYTLWIGDEQRAPVRVYDRFTFSGQGASPGIDGFWFEHNSSQGRTGGPTLYIWERNIAVLRNINLTQAQSWVDAGDQT